MFSFLFNNRLFKLFYSNFAERPSLSAEKMFEEVRIKRIYYSISYVSLICTVLSLLNGGYNIYLSIPLKVNITIQIDIERIILSTILIILHILEFTAKDRPKFIDNFLNKLHGEGPRGTRSSEKYNEVASVSLYSVPDQD